MVDALSIEYDYRRRQKRCAEIIAAFKAKIPVADIAAQFDVSPATVVKYARGAGLTRNRSNALMAPKICKLYAEGVPLKDMEAQLSIGRKAMWTYIKRAGLPLRQHHKKSAGQ